MNMRRICLAAIFFSFLPHPAPCQDEAVEDRLSELEVRVVKVEKRVTRLESTKGPVLASQKALANPIAAVFLKRENIMGAKRVAVRLFLELENTSNRRFEGFSGRIIFKDGDGRALYAKDYSRADIFDSGEKITLAVTITDTRAKSYLKLLKAKKIVTDFTRQKFF